MVAIVLFAVLLALFALPGYAWVGWLHREDPPDRATRVVLGWVWSFAVFALATGPFLWLHGNRTTCLVTAGAAWCAFALVAALLYARSARREKEAAVRAATPKESRPAPVRPQPAPDTNGGLAVLVLYAGLVGAVLGLWATGGEPRHIWITRAFPLVLLLGALLALALRRRWGSLLRLGPEDDAPPPRLWSVLAGALILFQAVGVLFYTRPDWDDCFCLAATLDYQQVETLNAQEPTHREGFPMPPIYLLMCWELSGATLGRAAGLAPLVVYHTALPALLVLASYAAYRSLLAELLPRRWVPLALLGLCGFHLWGISTLSNASNHFLVRIGQGKAVLLHIALPLTAMALIRFARQPGPRWWLTLCACVVAGLGLSTSALFLGVSLVACAVPVLLPAAPAGRRVAFAAGSALALAPTLGVGFLIWSAVHNDTVFDRPGGYTSWQRWFAEWDMYAGRGSAEVVWFLALPLLFVLLGGRRGRAYLVGMPAVLLLTFGNPFLYAEVAAKMTSGLTYYRLFWLYPVGMGLGVLLALLARLAGKAAAGFGVDESRAALTACLLGLFGSAALPGVFVWGDANSVGAFLTPGPVENLEAMPPDLKVIARLLADQPDIEGRRIVCGEEVASFLTPFDRRFRYVTTRQGYTIYYVGRYNSASEAAERLYLTDAIRLGPDFPWLTEQGWEMIVFTVAARKDPPPPDPWPTLERLPDLLDRYGVGYAIASPAVGYNVAESRRLTLVRDRTLSENGFRRVYRGVDYSLWKRDGPPAANRPGAPRPPAGTAPVRSGPPSGRGRPR